MISLINVDRRRFGESETVVEEYRGTSGDTKPDLLPNRNGSIFYEIDTKLVYMFDGDTLTWVVQ